MFGKKTTAEAGEAKPKAAKPNKKNAVKKGPSTNFFVAHAEKLGLGIVVLALGYLVYDGLGGEGYDPKREPKQLEQMADKLLTDIRNNDPWPQLKEERAIVHDFAKRTEEARQPSDPALYPLPVMEVQDKGAYEKRGDPELLAPIKVIGQSVVGLIAVEGSEKAIDPFEDFEDAEKLEGTSRKRDRDSRRAQASASGYGAGYGMEAGESGSGSAAGMPMGGYGMEGGNGLQRMFPPEYNRGFTPGVAGGMGGGYGMDAYGSGMGGSGGMPGYGSGMGGAASTGGSGASLTGGAAVKEKKKLAQPIFFNAVTALVPHEEMIKEYNAKLRESASFMLPRDLPIYLSFEVQRVQITDPNQPINEENWKTVTDASKQLAMMKNWLPTFPQQIPDVIDPSAADRALTMPIPPILIKDYRPFVKHPDIDWAWDAGMSQMQQMQVDPAMATTPQTVEGQLPGEQAPLGGMGGYGGGSGGYGMGGSGGMPGYGGESAGYGMGGSGGMPGYGGESAGYGMGGSGGMPGYGGESAGYGMEMGGSGMGGYGMGGSGMGGYGMGGSAMGGYGMGGMTRPAPYKMIRFYDQLSDKDVGKKFRYRVRVMMEDPNYPSDRFPAPRSSDMKDDVFARVAKLRQKEDAEAEKVRLANQNARPNTPLKVYNRTKRYTPWSEASNPIYVRGTEDVYVGRFGKPGSNDAPEAVLVKLDTQKGAYVPMYAFTTKDGKPKDTPPAYRRGTVLVMPKVTTQFAHPITTVMKEWPDYPGFTGGSTVVDIRGNNELVLSDSKEDPLTDNGEMMVLMGDGRVEITNEFDDAFWYRGFTLADEREAADKAGPSSPDATAAPGPAGTSSSGSR